MNVYLGRWDSDNMWRDSCGGDHSSWWEILASDRSPRRRLKQNAFDFTGDLTYPVCDDCTSSQMQVYWHERTQQTVMNEGVLPGCPLAWRVSCQQVWVKGEISGSFPQCELRLADRLRFQLHSCWLKLHLYFWLRLGLWGYRHLFMRPLGLHAVTHKLVWNCKQSPHLRESYRIEILISNRHQTN